MFVGISDNFFFFEFQMSETNSDSVSKVIEVTKNVGQATDWKSVRSS